MAIETEMAAAVAVINKKITTNRINDFPLRRVICNNMRFVISKIFISLFKKLYRDRAFYSAITSIVNRIAVSSG
jgi:hypothetical protein